MDSIHVRGAREHNLKNVNVSIPARKLVVFTGVSGSGKSSLAFDTIYAEGQRRYVESLSSYARQFLGQMDKPDVDSISGLSPTIAIEQKATISNPRSTVGTITEIYDYLRVLFARIGTIHCYQCQGEVTSRSVDQIVTSILQFPEGTRLLLLAPLARNQKGDLRGLLESARKEGFVRVRVDGEIHLLDDEPHFQGNARHNADVVVDRLVVKDGIKSRLADSLEVALRHGKGVAIARRTDSDVDELFSERSYCVPCDKTFQELTPRLFSFNSPEGMCPDCNGLGISMRADIAKIVPDDGLSISEGALKPWTPTSTEGGESVRQEILQAVCEQFQIDPHSPWKDLTEDARSIMLYGAPEKVRVQRRRGSEQNVSFTSYEGVCTNVQRLWHETKSHEMRRFYAGFLRECLCQDCMGKRLCKTACHVRMEGETLPQLADWPLSTLAEYFQTLNVEGYVAQIAQGILREIGSRLRFLNEVGLGYLQLSRAASTLSGGESQRIRLAGQIGSELTGVTYVLDEPSIGLHPRDNHRLIAALLNLRDLGNSVLVVEHDADMIRAADYVVDFGPRAGQEGGEVVAAGTVAELCQASSLTGDYLSGRRRLSVDGHARQPTGTLVFKGAHLNNLKSIDVLIPRGVFTVVTGVSGAGKSTLVNQVIRPTLTSSVQSGRAEAVGCEEVIGWRSVGKVVAIDQGPIGRTPRSNPATYTKLFDEIRTVFAGTPDARMHGYKPGRFSFNVKGGRCENCVGAGVIRVEMHFLADVFVTCPECEGRRFNESTLRVRYNGKSIADVLSMRVADARVFFRNHVKAKRILETLNDVGLGYIQLGQSSTTLSGGEAQRIKLSRELARAKKGHVVYLLDEPSTGLHFADIEKLLEVLHRLADRGDTVVLIEHHLDIIQAADHVVDIGPGGGEQGGHVVASGSPQELAMQSNSVTGRFIKGREVSDVSDKKA